MALGGIMEHMLKENIKPTGVLIILVSGKKFLLMQRDNKPQILNPNKWAPITGGVETGEDIETTVKRELAEEIPIEEDILPKNLITLGISEKGVGFCFARLSKEDLMAMNMGDEGQRFHLFTIENLLEKKSSGELGGTFPIYLEKYLPIFKKIAEENYTPTAEDFGLEKIQDHADELKTSMKLH